ncbi:MAG TPA: DNA adenine methylase [Candidatus Paceibacterota bacterium]|nr:DNA adenine methylase [Candidatus Paceibacterota bacterium]
MQKQHIDLNLLRPSNREISTPNTQALIKWPGGKKREFSFIKHHIPAFDRYIEPFFGGGAIFFELQPERAAINDIAVELMDFYRFVGGKYNTKEFSKEIYEYVFNWEKIPNYILLFQRQFISLYARYAADSISKNDLRRLTEDYIHGQIQAFNGLFRADFCIDRNNLEKRIIDNLIDKITRVKKLEFSSGRISIEDLHKNIETAFRSGFYMHFRDVMNEKRGMNHISRAKAIANYYFIREFCYGSMFRFNANGEFNIPYGGIGYNTKNFRKKVDRLFSLEAHNLLAGAVIYNEDFETFLNKLKLSSKDFIFLDPPYDTDFSDYEKKSFDRDDQFRLARYLYTTKAKFILVIKRTSFIYGLYKGKQNINISSFDKKYTYNMKGRNDRAVQHLIVKNF